MFPLGSRCAVLSLALFLSLGVTVAACGGSSGGSPTSPTTPTRPTYAITSFITGISSIAGTAGTQISSAPIASGAPGFTPTTSSGVINGGSRVVRIQSSTAFTIVYITVANVDVIVTGYWTLTLPSATTDTYIIITMSRTMPKSMFSTNTSIASGTGQMTTPVEVATTVLSAATGDVQVSVSWNTPTDVDLQVVEPGGERIYWGHRTSATGGALDLDSNASCSIDNKNNENIRWSTAPAGSYTVAVDYYASCGVSQTQYVVTVNNGGSQAVYTGTFTGGGDFNSSPRSITTFTKGAGLMSMAEALRTILPVLPPGNRKSGS